MRKNDLILVIDMQNVYKSGAEWACAHTDSAMENIIKIIDVVEKCNISSGPEIIFTRFKAPEDPVGTWRDYNRINYDINVDITKNQLIDKMTGYAEHFNIIDKSTYSCLGSERIRRLAREHDRLILTGLVAECCVLATAFQAIDLGIDIVYVKDAVSGISDETEKAAITVLEGLTYVQTHIMTADEYSISGK